MNLINNNNSYHSRKIRPRTIDLEMELPVLQISYEIEELENLIKDSKCNICGKESENLIYCDICTKAYHLFCLEPPLKKIPKEMWLCPTDHLTDFESKIIENDLPILENNKLDEIIPIPEVRIIEESYENNTNYVHPDSYIKYIEKDFDEIIEYEIDSEDEEFLNHINQDKTQKIVTEEILEEIIDTLEKQVFYEKNNNLKYFDFFNLENKKNFCEYQKENFCCICGNNDVQGDNELVCCIKCNILVHQQCYRIKNVDIENYNWLCDACKCDATDIKCSICNKFGGAFKATNEGEWAHVICALCIPDLSIISTSENCDIIQGIDHLKLNEQFSMICSLCGTVGICIQCQWPECNTVFHPSCASKLQYMNKNDSKKYVYMPCFFEIYCYKHYGMIKKNEFSDKLELVVCSIAIKPIIQKIYKLPINTIDGICKYWLNKRKLKNKPLIKRFQEFNQKLLVEKKNKPIKKNSLQSLLTLKLIRQTMERVRILLDLIKKREEIKKHRLEVVKDIVQNHLLIDDYSIFSINYPLQFYGYKKETIDSNNLLINENKRKKRKKEIEIEIENKNDDNKSNIEKDEINNDDFEKEYYEEEYEYEYSDYEDEDDEIYIDKDDEEYKNHYISKKNIKEKQDILLDGEISNPGEVINQHCHHCKKRRPRCAVCPFNKTHRYCYSCVLRHFDLDFDTLTENPLKYWGKGCPRCVGICPCAVCRNLNNSKIICPKKKIRTGQAKDKEKKNVTREEENEINNKRKPGRPKKISSNNLQKPIISSIKRKPGRPRKNKKEKIIHSSDIICEICKGDPNIM
jgi:hypothetical protein